MIFIAADDEKNALEDMACTLKECIPEGAELYTANSSKAALELVEKYKPFMAFLDITMPGLDGFALEKKISEISPRTNIVFVTGYADEYGTRAWKTNACHFVEKPLLSEDVELAISRARHSCKLLKVKCFGGFQVFADGKPLIMTGQNDSVKELFAYLIYKRGAACSNDTLITIVKGVDAPNDNNSQTAVRKAIKKLRDVLASVGAENVLIRGYNSTAVDTDKIDCDWYDHLDSGDPPADRHEGEFLPEFLWAR